MDDRSESPNSRNGSIEKAFSLKEKEGMDVNYGMLARAVLQKSAEHTGLSLDDTNRWKADKANVMVDYGDPIVAVWRDDASPVAWEISVFKDSRVGGVEFSQHLVIRKWVSGSNLERDKVEECIVELDESGQHGSVDIRSLRQLSPEELGRKNPRYKTYFGKVWDKDSDQSARYHMDRLRLGDFWGNGIAVKEQIGIEVGGGRLLKRSMAYSYMVEANRVLSKLSRLSRKNISGLSKRGVSTDNVILEIKNSSLFATLRSVIRKTELSMAPDAIENFFKDVPRSGWVTNPHYFA